MLDKWYPRIRNSSSNHSKRFLFLYFANALPYRANSKLPPTLLDMSDDHNRSRWPHLVETFYPRDARLFCTTAPDPLSVWESRKALVVMQGSERADHTLFNGTISLKLRSSCRRSSAYDGSGVIFLGSSSISMPLLFNMERVGIMFGRHVAAMKTS